MSLTFYDLLDTMLKRQGQNPKSTDCNISNKFQKGQQIKKRKWDFLLMD